MSDAEYFLAGVIAVVFIDVLAWLCYKAYRDIYQDGGDGE